LYLFAFFFLYCLLLVAPELVEVARSHPPGPDQEAAAREAARRAMRPRLPVAFGLALATVAIAGHLGKLPGLRRR
jgi:hypothetical protein